MPRSHALAGPSTSFLHYVVEGNPLRAKRFFTYLPRHSGFELAGAESFLRKRLEPSTLRLPLEGNEAF